jgi:hypothetical protein
MDYESLKNRSQDIIPDLEKGRVIFNPCEESCIFWLGGRLQYATFHNGGGHRQQLRREGVVSQVLNGRCETPLPDAPLDGTLNSKDWYTQLRMNFSAVQGEFPFGFGPSTYGTQLWG